MIEGAPTPAQIQSLSRDELAALQSRRLRAMLDEIGERNGFYRSKLEGAGITPADIRSPADLSRLPFTTKAELVADQQEHPPYGTILTYPIERYTRLHQTSGTTGRRPLRWLDTKASWSWLLDLWDIIYAAAGVRPSDRLFFPYSFGPFIGFWAAFEAATRMGNLTLPGGAMNSPARLKFMIENEATVVACTPTYALHLIEVAGREGLDLAASAVRLLIVAGEPGGSIPEVRGRIEAGWGARVLDHSGMTEIGPLGFESIEAPGGLYLAESDCVVEIIDPDTEEPAAPGDRGELVVTPLGRLGSPLIRYRTGDLVRAAADPPGDWPFIWLEGGILGRIDDMVIVRGNNIYPSALDAVLRRFDEVIEYRAEVAREDGLDILRLTVESAADLGSNDRTLPDRIANAVKETFNFRPEVTLAGPGELPRFELKAARFIIHPSMEKEGTRA